MKTGAERIIYPITGKTHLEHMAKPRLLNPPRYRSSLLKTLTSMSTSYPTPVYPHLSSPAYRDVYEPAEDSFLFMDALEKEAGFLKQLKWVYCNNIP